MLVPLYASTLFVTSALLFVLEPLVARGLLPVLGGGAAVWTTAVAFFQLALLAGYLYAHLAPSWLSARRHAFVHVGLLAGVAIALPLRTPADLVPPATHQALWLFGRLAVSIGPAFVLLAATAPLVQRWLASTGHPRGARSLPPYAASNVGSLARRLSGPDRPLLGLSGSDASDDRPPLAVAGGHCAVAVRRARAGAAGPRRHPLAPKGTLERADRPRRRLRGSHRLRWLVPPRSPASCRRSRAT